MWKPAGLFALAFFLGGFAPAQAVLLKEGEFIDYRLAVDYDADIMAVLWFFGNPLDVGESGIYSIGTNRGGSDEYLAYFENNGDGCNGGICPPVDPDDPYINAPYYDYIISGGYNAPSLTKGLYFLRVMSTIGSFDVSVEVYDARLAPIPLPSPPFLFLSAFGIFFLWTRRRRRLSWRGVAPVL